MRVWLSTAQTALWPYCGTTQQNRCGGTDAGAWEGRARAQGGS